jgi:hypothetical protein
MLILRYSFLDIHVAASPDFASYWPAAVSKLVHVLRVNTIDQFAEIEVTRPAFGIQSNVGAIDS